jgi:hypothetical protein
LLLDKALQKDGAKTKVAAGRSQKEDHSLEKVFWDLPAVNVVALDQQLN